jgi:hypothetical protein
MLVFLRGRASERKLRLFAVACAWRAWRLLEGEGLRAAVRKALTAAERYADVQALSEELTGTRWGTGIEALQWSAIQMSRGFEAVARGARASEAGPDQSAADAAAHASTLPGQNSYGYFAAAWRAADAAHHAGFSRDAELHTQAGILRDLFGPTLFTPVSVLSGWLTLDVLRIAKTIYDDRSFGDLPVLADALEEEGCTSAALLDHCRSGEEHFLGCWGVDLVLRKE